MKLTHWTLLIVIIPACASLVYTTSSTKFKNNKPIYSNRQFDKKEIRKTGKSGYDNNKLKFVNHSQTGQLNLKIINNIDLEKDIQSSSQEIEYNSSKSNNKKSVFKEWVHLYFKWGSLKSQISNRKAEYGIQKKPDEQYGSINNITNKQHKETSAPISFRGSGEYKMVYDGNHFQGISTNIMEDRIHSRNQDIILRSSLEPRDIIIRSVDEKSMSTILK